MRSDDPPADLRHVLDLLLRFGAMMLRAGDTALRVREWMGVIARGFGLDALAVHVTLGGMIATARRGANR